MVGLKIYIPWWVCSCCERINHEHDKRTIFIVDVESLRRHYGKTLQHWARNFENVLEEVRKTKDERFIRMWRLYLNRVQLRSLQVILIYINLYFQKGLMIQFR